MSCTHAYTTCLSTKLNNESFGQVNQYLQCYLVHYNILSNNTILLLLFVGI